MKVSKKKVNQLFIEAIEVGDLETVKYLLNDSPVKANIHLTNEAEDPEYCLSIATEFNHLPILKYFLEETELKEYTKQKGIKEFVNSYLYDTLNIMYEHAGQNGNIDMINYLTTKLPLEDKFQIFYNAAYQNHVHVMDYMVQNNMLSENDKNSLGVYNNKAIEWSIKYKSKEAFHYLIDYYESSPYKKMAKGINFKINCLLRAVDGIKEATTDFEIFNIFFNDKEMKNHYQELKSKNFYKEIAKKKNLELYSRVIEIIKDKEFKKEVVLNSYFNTAEDKGSLDNYPLYTHILSKYKSYFNKEEKERIFYGLIFSYTPQRLHELMQYDFLKKGTNPNLILKEAFDKLYVEDTFEYIKEILVSEFKTKIKLNLNDYDCFKKMSTLTPGKTIELLTIVLENYSEMKPEKIETFFEEKSIQEFIQKWKLHNKLMLNLTPKSESVKKMKI